MLDTRTVMPRCFKPRCQPMDRAPSAVGTPTAQREHARLQMMFIVSHLWAKGAGFGMVVNVTDMRVIREEPDERAELVCPFPLG